jgi:hypothetical protein
LTSALARAGTSERAVSFNPPTALVCPIDDPSALEAGDSGPMLFTALAPASIGIRDAIAAGGTLLGWRSTLTWGAARDGGGDSTGRDETSIGSGCAITTGFLIGVEMIR